MNIRWSVIRIIILVTMLAILSLEGCSGSVPVEMWNKTFGGNNYDEAFYVQQTYDGGYIIAGMTSSFGKKFHDRNVIVTVGDAWIIKTDAEGNELWNKTFGETYLDFAYNVRQTSDGGYIFAGVKNSGLWTVYSFKSIALCGGDAYLSKIDANGNELWSKIFGAGGINSFQPTTDSGYILAGWTYSLGSTRDAWLIKTDANGHEQWNKTFGVSGYNEAYSVLQTADGNYIFSGLTASHRTSSIRDAWLVKVNASGDEQWSKTFGGISNGAAYYVQQTLDGGYIFICNHLLIKTDENGNIIWNKTFKGRLYSVQLSSDGGYILSGQMGNWNGAGMQDIKITKTDAEGNELWNWTSGGTLNDWAYYAMQTLDGDYIVTGSTGSDAWLLKVTPPTILTISTRIPPTMTPTPISTPSQLDYDGDGWSDEKERLIGTYPYSVDSDKDGINDPQDSNPTVPEKKTPGFEVAFTFAGLLAVAYLLKRRQ